MTDQKATDVIEKSRKDDRTGSTYAQKLVAVSMRIAKARERLQEEAPNYRGVFVDLGHAKTLMAHILDTRISMYPARDATAYASILDAEESIQAIAVGKVRETDVKSWRDLAFAHIRAAGLCLDASITGRAA